MNDIPKEFMQRWQQAADQMARVAGVPAALVMRVWPEQIEVLISSLGEDNPYEEHEKADLGAGLYCETVMATRTQLMVPDALNDPLWCENPDIKLNMISYLGVPLIWPDESIFGTVCVLDRRARAYSDAVQQLLARLKALIESDFGLLCGERASDPDRWKDFQQAVQASAGAQ